MSERPDLTAGDRVWARRGEWDWTHRKRELVRVVNEEQAREREPADAALAEAVELLRLVMKESSVMFVGARGGAVLTEVAAFLDQHAAPEPEEPPLPEWFDALFDTYEGEGGDSMLRVEVGDMIQDAMKYRAEQAEREPDRWRRFTRAAGGI